MGKHAKSLRPKLSEKISANNFALQDAGDKNFTTKQKIKTSTLEPRIPVISRKIVKLKQNLPGRSVPSEKINSHFDERGSTKRRMH